MIGSSWKILVGSYIEKRRAKLFHWISFAVACNWVSLFSFRSLLIKWSCSCADVPKSQHFLQNSVEKSVVQFSAFFSHSFSTQMTCSQARWLNTSRLDYRPLAPTTHGILEPRMISRETIHPIDCDNRNGADWVSETEKWMCKRETLFADCTSLYSSICSMLPG